MSALAILRQSRIHSDAIGVYQEEFMNPDNFEIAWRMGGIWPQSLLPGSGYFSTHEDGNFRGLTKDECA
jgi:hypothetical protein